MRLIATAGALLLIGSAAAQAQPFFGCPSPSGFGFGWPDPHPHPHRHCHSRFNWRGPVRVCCWGW